MSDRVLVIGGSYFLGRIFCTLASRLGDMELTLLNRGRYPMTHLPHLTEFHGDRHDAAALAALPRENWDAVVDFCAYAPGDVRFLLENLPGSVKRYILISTADVCIRQSGVALDETAPLLTEPPQEAAGDYAWQKLLLEGELAEVCREKGVEFVILRPAFIYGPYNYAPRESWYIEMIVRGQLLPLPLDSTGRFTTVYVKDAAEAIIACIRQKAAAGQIYHLAAPEVLDYPALLTALRIAADRPFETLFVSVEEVLRDGIPLPFPLKEEESELFDGGKIARELGLVYTPYQEGMKKTFQSFRSVYE